MIECGVLRGCLCSNSKLMRRDLSPKNKNRLWLIQLWNDAINSQLGGTSSRSGHHGINNIKKIQSSTQKMHTRVSYTHYSSAWASPLTFLLHYPVLYVNIWLLHSLWELRRRVMDSTQDDYECSPHWLAWILAYHRTSVSAAREGDETAGQKLHQKN